MTEKSISELKIANYVVDIFQEGSIIEIQTGNFGAIRNKLLSLLSVYSVTLVYPISIDKKIIVYDKDHREILYTRKSPKKGTITDLAYQIIYISHIIRHPNFRLEVVLIKEEETRIKDGTGSWRRKGIRILNRSLVEVLEKVRFLCPTDYLTLLPKSLPVRFTNRELSIIMNQPLTKIRRLTYGLKHIGVLTVTGKSGKAFEYEITKRT